MTLREIWQAYFGRDTFVPFIDVPLAVLCRVMPLSFVLARWWPFVGRDSDHA